MVLCLVPLEMRTNDDDVDIMTFYPDDRKMFKKVVGEFNKYGMNVFMQDMKTEKKILKKI